MSIGNNAFNMYFFLCQDTVSLNWRFLTSPAARDSYVRALARNRAECELTEGNLIINCFEFVFDNRYSNNIILGRQKMNNSIP